MQLPWLGSDAQAFEYFRVKAAPSLSGHFSANVFEHLVLQLSERHPYIRHASVAIGSLSYFKQSGPGCLASFKTAKAQHDLALTSYGKAVAGLRSYIEQVGEDADEEVTIVVLVACLLFVCFEMMQGAQASVISHLVKGLKILFSQYKSSSDDAAISKPEMKSVIVGNDFPKVMDNLVDVFVRLDADSTMFGRRSTYLCTTCRCCCRGHEVYIEHSFTSLAETRSHLDLLTSAAFSLRGRLLKLTEQILHTEQEAEYWTESSDGEDWATRYCHLYTMSRFIDLENVMGGPRILAKQKELIAAFEAWRSALNGLAHDVDDLSVTMLRIQHFFSWFVVSVLRDPDNTSCDRFKDSFLEIVELASKYIDRTKNRPDRCAFTLESGVLRSLYIIGLKCRDSALRWRATELLRASTVQEGLWSGRMFAAYVQRIIELEEARARALRPDVPMDVPLTYNTVPEEARFCDVVVANDDTLLYNARLVCALSTPEHQPAFKIIEDRFQLLSLGSDNQH